MNILDHEEKKQIFDDCFKNVSLSSEYHREN